MKGKCLILILVSILVFMLTSCGNGIKQEIYEGMLDYIDTVITSGSDIPYSYLQTLKEKEMGSTNAEVTFFNHVMGYDGNNYKIEFEEKVPLTLLGETQEFEYKDYSAALYLKDEVKEGYFVYLKDKSPAEKWKKRSGIKEIDVYGLSSLILLQDALRGEYASFEYKKGVYTLKKERIGDFAQKLELENVEFSCVRLEIFPKSGKRLSRLLLTMSGSYIENTGGKGEKAYDAEYVFEFRIYPNIIPYSAE